MVTLPFMDTGGGESFALKDFFFLMEIRVLSDLVFLVDLLDSW